MGVRKKPTVQELLLKITALEIERDLFTLGHRNTDKHAQDLEARVAELEGQIKHWRSNHDNMVRKAAFLSQRPDLPVDRIPAYRELIAAREQLAAQTARIDALLAHCPDGECYTCGSIICPHQCELHFHHDGCPACAEHETAHVLGYIPELGPLARLD